MDGRSLKRVDLRDADILLVRSVTPVTEALLAGTWHCSGSEKSGCSTMRSTERWISIWIVISGIAR